MVCRTIEESRTSGTTAHIVPLQLQIVQAIASFLTIKTADDLREDQEILSVAAETLHQTLNIAPEIIMNENAHIIEIIFVIAKAGASNIYLKGQVEGIFEDATSGLQDNFAAYCHTVMQPIVGVIDADDLSSDNPFTNVGKVQSQANLSNHHR